MSVSRIAYASLCLLALLSLSLPVYAFTFSQKDAGARAHPFVLERHGGALENPALQDYVTQIGRRLASVTAQPDEEWSFTILDDPAIRAFAQPGGYIYVSRGLMAFAASEAELAAAIAHQMAHQLRNHLGLGTRRPLGTGLAGVPDRLEMISSLPGRSGNSSSTAREVGTAPFLTVKQEVIAAQDGILILAKANYPTSAAADLAERLIVQDASWGEAGVLPVRMLGSLPQDRADVATAIIASSASTTVFEADPRRMEYLRALHGMVWGNSPEQGFVRGNSFLHPAMGFTFDAPLNFQITHTPAEVVASGPNGARMVLDTTNQTGPRLESYIRDVWAPNLTRTVKAGYLYDLRSTVLGGQEAATAFQPYEDETGAKVAQLTVIRAGERVFRFLNVAPAEEIGASIAMEEALTSFRLLSLAEAAAERPLRLYIHEVQPGDSINLFAATMPYRNRAEDRFRRLNGLKSREVPLVGTLVKLVVE